MRSLVKNAWLAVLIVSIVGRPGAAVAGGVQAGQAGSLEMYNLDKTFKQTANGPAEAYSVDKNVKQTANAPTETYSVDKNVKQTASAPGSRVCTPGPIAEQELSAAATSQTSVWGVTMQVWPSGERSFGTLVAMQTSQVYQHAYVVEEVRVNDFHGGDCEDKNTGFTHYGTPFMVTWVQFVADEGKATVGGRTGKNEEIKPSEVTFKAYWTDHNCYAKEKHRITAVGIETGSKSAHLGSELPIGVRMIAFRKVQTTWKDAKTGTPIPDLTVEYDMPTWCRHHVRVKTGADGKTPVAYLVAGFNYNITAKGGDYADSSKIVNVPAVPEGEHLGARTAYPAWPNGDKSMDVEKKTKGFVTFAGPPIAKDSVEKTFDLTSHAAVTSTASPVPEPSPVASPDDTKVQEVSAPTEEAKNDSNVEQHDGYVIITDPVTGKRYAVMGNREQPAAVNLSGAAGATAGVGGLRAPVKLDVQTPAKQSLDQPTKPLQKLDKVDP